MPSQSSRIQGVPRQHKPNETREFRHLEQVYTTLAENEEWMAVNIDKTIQRRENDDNRAALADEEKKSKF
jgi:hypothetical protein